MSVPKIDWSHGSETRNIINRVIEEHNQHGKTIQTLVAEGQLTPNEYAQLIRTVNGLISKGDVTLDDLDKSNFKLDGTWFTHQFLADLANGEINTTHLLDKSVGFEKIDFEDEIAVRAVNMLENSGFTKDSDGDGLADGWWGGAPDNTMNLTKISNGKQYWLPDSITNRLENKTNKNVIAGHKYYISAEISNIGNIRLTSSGDIVLRDLEGGRVSTIYAAPENGSALIRFYPKTVNVESYVGNVLMVDLTATFGAGNEPDVGYLEYLMSLLGAGSWFDNTLNFTDASKNGIVTAKDLKLHDPNNVIGTDNVNDALIDFADGVVKALPGKNLYNPDENVNGTLIRISPGSIQGIDTVNNPNNHFSQKIKITNTDDVTMTNIVAYAITDLRDVVLKEREFIGGQSVTTISASEIDNDEYYLWVSVRDYELSGAQIEYGDSSTSYEPHKAVSAVYANGIKLFDYPLEVDSDSVSTPEFESAINRLENRMNQIEDSYLVPGDNQVIPLSNTTDSQKLILHLHRREKEEGFGTFNNAYVPNAKTDFSDIKITTEKGASLPYRMTHLSHDFDIVPYDWVRSGSMASATLMDSKGDLYQVDNYIRKSTDKGNTWTDIPTFTEFYQPNLNLIAQDDTMYFNIDKKLYRSEAPYESYQMVFDLDPNNKYDSVHISGKSLVQHPDGELFAGLYQGAWHIRIYKSTDNGLTWQLSADWGDKYQHVHGMFADPHTGAIYAGLDGGGGVLKTTDKGATWINLREEYPDMPQSTDYGVRYSDSSGYRLLGGETPIVGGHSIIKTFDDKNFYPVLSDGISVNYVVKLGSRMFATGSGSHGFRNGAIYISRDDAENWEGVYRTSPLLDLWSANDGYRYMEQISDNEIFVGPQYFSRPPLRIFGSGNYAEIIVDVPAGTNSLTIESGHRESNVLPIANDSDFEGEKLVHFEMNENSTVIKELVSGEEHEDNIEWTEGGKRLSYFNPDIRSSYDNKSALMHSLTGYAVGTSNFDTSQGITISFWAKLSLGTRFTLMEDEAGNTLDIVNGSQLHLNNNNIVSFNFPVIPQTFIKHDILIRNDGNVSVYTNGIFRSTLDYSTKGVEVLDFISNSNNLTFLSNNNANFEDAIQHFIIRKGIISDEQLLKESHADLSDNI